MELRKRFLVTGDGAKAHCAAACCVRLLSASEPGIISKGKKKTTHKTNNNCEIV